MNEPARANAYGLAWPLASKTTGSKVAPAQAPS